MTTIKPEMLRDRQDLCKMLGSTDDATDRAIIAALIKLIDVVGGLT